MDWHPRVDLSLCVGCGKCLAFCPHQVYALEGAVCRVTRPNKCVILCAECLPLCPTGAISFPPQKTYRELTVPGSLPPRRDPENPCQERPVDLTVKKGVLFWRRDVGERVEQGESVCEGEAAKQVLDFTAPVSGILAEQCVGDEEVFSAGTILGYIKTDE